ncbi:hypothetical protein [Pelomonas cellulosilytica]|uniref:Transmembrane protein n=1 Tax=Pelomonas cellulosilytica TaxID=2906762 RepID=A0ABS8XUI1_9BURK|nr:hypothetical protein [Pelomonas sp. P8]MCE4556346.1 hypothetical protein [Pelomonas sp. P8]
MMFARLLIGLLLFSAIVCLALSVATGQRRWRRLGLIILKWTVIAGLAFFAVLILERLALLL